MLLILNFIDTNYIYIYAHTIFIWHDGYKILNISWYFFGLNTWVSKPSFKKKTKFCLSYTHIFIFFSKRLFGFSYIKVIFLCNIYVLIIVYLLEICWVLWIIWWTGSWPDSNFESTGLENEKKLDVCGASMARADGPMPVSKQMEWPVLCFLLVWEQLYMYFDIHKCLSFHTVL